MCADEAGMEWGKAWQAKAPPPQKLGFIYMLRGDNGTSNTDPYATKETPDNNWIKTGPHVMIVGGEAKHDSSLPERCQAGPGNPYIDFNQAVALPAAVACGTSTRRPLFTS
jgi:hypothetical protein